MRCVLAIVLVARAAHAQPVTSPDALPPLAEIRDDKQLAETLSAIVQDPSVHVDDDRARQLAQALMAEGVRQLKAQAYDQALANFLEAYNKLPSPKILLNIASTPRDMGRLADAANTYQRYLTDPVTGPERVAEVKELLLKLDAQLTILTVRVFPRGSDVSIDAGPFVSVGSSLLTRVRTGLHLVRIQKGNASNEVTVNGFEAETKDVSVALQIAIEPDKPTPTPTPTPMIEAAPEHVEGWLITGTQYAADSGTGRARRVRTGAVELAPIVPKLHLTAEPEEVLVPDEPERAIASGVVGVLRIDGKGRGAAGGLGIAYAPSDTLELELAGLKSDVWGAYAGARYRFLTGWVRPYAAAGLPLFFFTDDSHMSKIAFGARLAGGVELMINGHLSVAADLGIEHFFNVGDTIYKMKRLEETVFVPTLGLIGRM